MRVLSAARAGRRRIHVEAVVMDTAACGAFRRSFSDAHKATLVASVLSLRCGDTITG